MIQQEREINYARSSMAIPTVSTTEEATAFQLHNSHSGHANGKNGQFFRGKPQGGARGHNRVCTHCGRTNHTVETCFLKHGYPPGFKGKGKNQSSNTSNQNVVASVHAGSDESQPSFGFTQDQYNNILALIQQSQLTPQANSISPSPFGLNSHAYNDHGKNPNLWIFDTGATDHIAYDLASFESYKHIIPVHVSLPYSSQIIASMSGSIVLSPTLTLHNVLYIPTFHVNLLSIAKLVNSNDCHVNFTANSCTILQNHSKAVIGTTNLQRGLCVLDATPQSQALHSNTAFSSMPPHYKLTELSLHLELEKLFFLGFKEGTKGYILYDLQHHNIFVSRHIVFYETYFPFKTPNTSAPEPKNTTLMACPTYDDPLAQPILSSTTHDNLSPQSHVQPAIGTSHQMVINVQSHLSPNLQPVMNDLSQMSHSSTLLDAHRSDNQTIPIRTSLTPLSLPDGQSHVPPATTVSPAAIVSPAVPITTQQPTTTEQPHVPLPEPEPTNNAEMLHNRNSTRVSHPPSYLADYHCYNTIHHSPISLKTKPKLSTVAYPLSSVLTHDHYIRSGHAFVVGEEGYRQDSEFQKAKDNFQVVVPLRVLDSGCGNGCVTMRRIAVKCGLD
ncbi:hypothetical protein KIW84_036007 [Lathyrus oleraceus]|uniref:Uncharacterized protein n=1 Tax=Pisum sativum TaxID=3888 RepID=A0A9D4Y716_PEA|nr:hypothetical protein KIW84_036007 [Pisum sativum]